jgi:hypothetical protein
MIDPSMIAIFDVPFPSPPERVFDKALWTDWYDGITGALVAQMRPGMAVSPFEMQNFDRVVALLARAGGAPTWPKWNPAWPSGTPDNEYLKAEIEKILNTAGTPTHVLASNADFNPIDQIKQLDEAAVTLLPRAFEGVPFRDNFEYWRQYLGVEKQKLPWAS